MISFLKLIRYKNLLMVLLTMVLTKYAVIDAIENLDKFNDFQFLLLIIAVLCITAAGYIINDIYDIEADKLNKQGRNLVGSYFTKKSAWFLYFLFNSLGLGFGIYLSIHNHANDLIWVFVSSIVLLFLYSLYFKKVPILGNFIIALLCGFTIFITYAFQNTFATSDLDSHVFLYKTIIVYIFFSVITTFIREIIKDIEDVDGDLKINAKTLPILLGRKRAANFAFFFSAILLVFLLIILQYLKEEVLFLTYGIVLILLPLSYFMYKLWFSESKKDFSKLSNWMKIIMLFGIISMLLFRI